MNQRENMLRTIRFERPDYIPMSFHINAACWQHYDQEQLLDLIEDHPFLFPGFKRPALPFKPEFARVARKHEPYRDDFGCLWQTTDDGITGTVTGHPLADLADYPDYRFPDPETCCGIGPIDWEEIARDIRKAKHEGRFTSGGLRHGHTFLQLSDLRGYQNLLYDMTDDEPVLWNLIERLEAFNLAIIRHYVDLEVDMVAYPEDLGMQKGPMLSPHHFRRYIKPSYQRLMKPARDKGLIVHMHSDGHLHDLIDDIIEGGVDVINLQDLVNGIDWIAARFAGKTCVDLDIDRQQITPYGTPAQVDELLRSEIQKIGRREGGLILTFGLYPGTPVANVKALMDAMERYAFLA